MSVLTFHDRTDKKDKSTTDRYTFKKAAFLLVAGLVLSTPAFGIIHKEGPTPDEQLIINPALNSDEDVLWVFGLQAWLTL